MLPHQRVKVNDILTNFSIIFMHLLESFSLYFKGNKWKGPFKMV